ncbi:Hypothetical predicted protein [Mytilus galloprovincialis]|uniref:Mab-21-like HhH/H2TH-like domain-containing protein n=1 Tax=Mytilus galloprovincialis TaxID=29158 RepID=A0A8B6HB29_MYTGA|nr:Hypothetical predicted protein [Mytilus galloprovincialis]
MDKNYRNPKNDDGENVYGMRKITYLEKYGIKHFPYRGRRKYTPSMSQSVDTGMMISNDVFGLTIRQFERMYKECLHRRKTHEQWILNLRYPDKSSNKYLEYLQNCTDCNNDYLLCLENDPREKYLYKNLVKTIGAEIDIRKRQRLFIIQDMIHNACIPELTQISSGSLAEGLDLPGSDMDIMYVEHLIDVVQTERNIKYPTRYTTLIMEADTDHPGFTKLRFIAGGDGKIIRIHCDCNTHTCTTKFYLTVSHFLDGRIKLFRNACLHGPCISNANQNVDTAYCLRSRTIPHIAIPWVSRHRLQWPSTFVIDSIINYGCLLVPIGPKTLSHTYCDDLWRISFSVAEKSLVHSFNFTQILCYGLLKLTLKKIINTKDEVKDLLCSYFLKTALFWVSEEVHIDTFQLSKMYYCFSLCLQKLMAWVNKCYCPNYFIPEHNMFLGKINLNNHKILLDVLESIHCGGIDRLIQCIFPLYNDNENRRLLSTHSEFSFAMLDFLFYRINGHINEFVPKDIFCYYKGRAFIESLLKSETSSFIIDVCKYNYVNISQLAVQLLPPPNTLGNKYAIHKCYQRHFQDSIKTDAVSGWLLYASFFYVTGQFNVTLRLTDYVLSKCSPGMVFKCGGHSCGHRDRYKQNVHFTMTLNEKMKIAIVSSVSFLKHSSLLPAELRLENKDFRIPPVVLSHCLRFLCNHHLGDVLNRQQALRDLYLTVEEGYLIPYRAELSDSFTIVGVCYDISGAKDTAYQCYEKALQFDGRLSSTAKKRISHRNGN